MEGGKPLAEGQFIERVFDLSVLEHFAGVEAYLAVDAGAQRFEVRGGNRLPDKEEAVSLVVVAHRSTLHLAWCIKRGRTEYFRVFLRVVQLGMAVVETTVVRGQNGCRRDAPIV